jgi:hypothetical protein
MVGITETIPEGCGLIVGTNAALIRRDWNVRGTQHSWPLGRDYGRRVQHIWPLHLVACYQFLNVLCVNILQIWRNCLLRCCEVARKWFFGISNIHSSASTLGTCFTVERTGSAHHCDCSLNLPTLTLQKWETLKHNINRCLTSSSDSP